MLKWTNQRRTSRGPSSRGLVGAVAVAPVGEDLASRDHVAERRPAGTGGAPGAPLAAGSGARESSQNMLTSVTAVARAMRMTPMPTQWMMSNGIQLQQRGRVDAAVDGPAEVRQQEDDEDDEHGDDRRRC